MTTRKISKKTRFEVFKRDSFACQYCGKTAPDVVLHIDHIVPVSKGGKDQILNLITACFDCNMGKSGVPLSEDSAVRKQMAQAHLINEKRSQIEMIGKWYQELFNTEKLQLKIYEDYLRTNFSISISNYGREAFNKLIKKYGMSTLMEATKASADTYCDPIDSPDKNEKFLMYISRICWWMAEEKKNPVMADVRRLANSAAKRWYKSHKRDLYALFKDCLMNLKLPIEKVTAIIYETRSVYQFEQKILNQNN